MIDILPDQLCPHCRQPCGGFVRGGDGKKPEADMIALCMNCAGFLYFNKQLVVQPLLLTDFVKLPGHVQRGLLELRGKVQRGEVAPPAAGKC